MKVVILAGGFGTRISEESQFKPKPMVELGGMPIIWHIMKLYSSYGFNEFIICAGYKQHVIKEYFADYFLSLIHGDETVLEKKPLETVAKLGELMAYKHTGFWQCMDTVREKEQLEKMWSNNNAPWKIWK